MARLFEEIAQSLERTGDERHRLRAYRRAARSVAAARPLEELVAEGRLREIQGIGPALEALITEYLATGAMRTHQQLLSALPPARKTRRTRGTHGLILKHAWETAAQIVELLQIEPTIRPLQIEIAGEVRRRCDMVTAGLDIVAVPAASRDQTLLDFLERLPNVVSLTSRTETYAAVRLYDGVEVRLHLTDPAGWGAALVRHTGSAAHLRRLHDLADGRPLVGATEDDVYRALDLPWIAPELREDTGEIEAALGGTLPKLVQLEDLRGDLHCHTNWTDGVATLEDMATAARARGYAYMALTDHSRSLTITNGLSLERLEEARRLVAQLNHRLAPFVILLGTEMDILEDGSLDYPDETLATLDYVSASVHRRFKQSADAMTARITRAVAHPLVQTLNHPHGRLLGIRREYEVDMHQVISTAVANGCALEVSGDPARMDLNGNWARQVKAAGGRCTISSDAHSTLDFDNIGLGVGSARRGWLGRDDVLNTRPLDEFRALLARHRNSGRGE